MEDALEEDIQINTADTFGNTLLILAAQQGSKRMCKFLLRRGANLNLQSLTGNTALHYCYAYAQFDLAEYLKTKGADDSILNADSMTCYEGLSADALKEEGEEDSEEEYDL
jgi:ankyrin repeat protein